MHYRKIDVMIIGAGAAGLMCAIEAGKRGRRVIILDHANKAGKKILMSGGGRCNFTNTTIQPDVHYLSHTKHFCRSALSRYTPANFIALVEKYCIPYHEKIHGQLFCNDKSQDILNMLLAECQKYTIQIYLNTTVLKIKAVSQKKFMIETAACHYQSTSLVIATGGLSIPTMGASAFGYKTAEQFELLVKPVRAGLVALTLQPEDKEKFSDLSGISIDCTVKSSRQTFRDQLLFTHRGLSGPAILQISSYWQPGENLIFNLLPEKNIVTELKFLQKQQPLKHITSHLAAFFPKKLIGTLLKLSGLTSLSEPKAQFFSHQQMQTIARYIHQLSLKPSGTEGYRTAEVTLGGVDCQEISSKTMEVKKHPGLYFIGEVLDVTGWLGGYNFQWAWASGFACGQVV